VRPARRQTAADDAQADALGLGGPVAGRILWPGFGIRRSFAAKAQAAVAVVGGRHSKFVASKSSDQKNPASRRT
jgi:hypothetical protein